MDRQNMNGHSTVLSQYETPFADVPVMRESGDQNISSEDYFSGYLGEVESPFSRTYEATAGSNVSQEGEEYVQFLSELNDSEFAETLYELANEVEDTWRNKVSNELAMGNNYIPFATQQAREYFAPLIRESESMIDRVAEHFSANNLADHAEAEVESFFESLEFNHAQYSPVQEQFLKKVFSKVKAVAKKGIELAKKGHKLLGKISPIHMILNKIKGLVKPLLDRVLKIAIGKLPKAIQPYAQTLAQKLLKLAPAAPADSQDQNANPIDSIQTELDHNLAQLVYSTNDQEIENLLNDYEFGSEQAERMENYESGNVGTPSLDVARQQFINELKNLKPGESPAPAIEQFVPVVMLAQQAIKVGIKLIGRQKIINYLAGLLAKLVGKYVPENVAKPLAAGIIDVGMKIIGFEVHETEKSDIAYETIANTIEETIQNMAELDETTINDSEALTVHLLEAFESAAANNFPPQYIKEGLRPTNQKAVWIRMPRVTPVPVYKKFTHVYDITIDPQTASSVTGFRSLPLANFLRDKYGLDTSKPIKARVHLYEALRGCRLSMISRSEKLPGLNAKQPKAWVQLLPLTKQAASLLLKEPALGKDADAQSLATRFRIKPGQRFYFLEIDGVRLRIPQVNRSNHKHSDNGRPQSGTESRSADIQAVINFIKSEIRLNYYFSEEDAIAVVEKLNKNDFLGAAISIRQSVKNVLNDILIKNIATKVKIVHEAVPELYLEHYSDQQEQFAPLAALGATAGKEIISKLIEKLIEKISTEAYNAVVSFFKARAAEFKNAQAQPQDGVTVKLTWSNIGGMSAIRAIINAIRGNLSMGNLTDLTLPNLPVPSISIIADKRFE